MNRGKISGNLRTYSLARLLCFAHRKRFSGDLVIHDDRDVRISFHQGIPLFCDQVNRDDLLGKLLVRAGLLEPGIVKAGLERQQADNRPLGVILRDMGLQAAGLFDVLHIQQKRKILRLFLLRHQDFSFDPAAALPKMAEELISKGQDAISLSWQGLTSIKPPEALEQDVAALDDMTLHCSQPVKLPDPHDAHHERTLELLGQRHWDLDQLHRAVGKRKPILQVVQFLWALGHLDIQPISSSNRRDRQPLSAGPVAQQPPPRQKTGQAPQAPARMTSMFRSVAEAGQDGAGPASRNLETTQPTKSSGPNRSSTELPTLPEDAPAQARSLHEEIGERLQKLADQNLFEVLGLGHDATKEQVKTAYIALAKKFHPDRVASLGIEELLEPADRVFQRISEAFTTLMNDSQREEYRHIIEDTSLPGDRQAARKVMEAEVDFQKGEVFLRKGDLDQAESFFARAVEGNPDEGEHLAMLTWVRHLKARKNRQTSPDEVTETRKALERARTLSPKCPRTHYFLGKILQEEGRPDSALESFRNALGLNKHYVEAAREIHIMELRMARKTKPAKTSIWDKLRGK